MARGEQSEQSFSTEWSCIRNWSKAWKTIICIYIITVCTKLRESQQTVPWVSKLRGENTSSLYHSGGFLSLLSFLLWLFFFFFVFFFFFFSPVTYLSLQHQKQHNVLTCEMPATGLQAVPPTGTCSVTATCASLRLNSASEGWSGRVLFRQTMLILLNFFDHLTLIFLLFYFLIYYISGNLEGDLCENEATHSFLLDVCLLLPEMEFRIY